MINKLLTLFLAVLLLATSTIFSQITWHGYTVFDSLFLPVFYSLAEKLLEDNRR